MNNELKELKDRIDNDLQRGRNILLTGPAGTGKSYNINYIKEKLDKEGKKIAVTSTTGISAINIEGITAHRFFGSLIYTEMGDLTKITSSKMWFSARAKMKEVDAIIIDEISMITAGQFELWSELAKIARRSNKPFGGLQVILSGDFMQLPPVIQNRKMEKEDWVFHSEVWKDLKLDKIFLNTVHRQDNIEFISHLSRIRYGFPTEETHALLHSLCNKQPKDDDTILVATNNEANAINNFRLNQIEGEEFVYNATFKGDKKQCEKLLKDLPVDETIKLKKGSIVLITVNDLAGGYANGTKGEVISLQKNSVTLLLENGKEVTIQPNGWDYVTLAGRKSATVSQLPLKLAWAITIHKSQGMTIKGLHIKCDKIFEKAQLYVAVSRSKNLEDLSISDYSENLIMVDENAREFYRRK